MTKISACISILALSFVCMFVAVQEQLGLKLESQKESVGIIVIESVEKPSEN